MRPLKEQRMVFIFDECHRSQFGENHKAIKRFFPDAQLFGFTGTPIFDKNATYVQATGEECHYMTTDDIFQKELHSYTITNAIEDQNVLRFHIDYFKSDNTDIQESDERVRKQAVVEMIVNKHRATTNDMRFNALFATASINDAIEYYNLFKTIQDRKKSTDINYNELNISCVFSPPAYGNKDVAQFQEDLQQERIDNQYEPALKKESLKRIIDEYNRRYGTSHSIEDFDAYYQDIQQRIKNQKYTNKDYSHRNKIDITIVVDMLLTGFDSKYLNTLYVDKNLKYHGLVQAFSRTNRILNDTKPYGNILDFRGQQAAVDEAVILFSGEKDERARQVWLVEPASEIIRKYNHSVNTLRNFMAMYNLEFKAEEVAKLRGDDAKAGFINCFKEVQRYKTQLNQYTDLKFDDDISLDYAYEPLAPYGFSDNDLCAFRGAYLELARNLGSRREKADSNHSVAIDCLDFEYVLFSSAIIDYDYIMELIARYYNNVPSVSKISKDDLIRLICSNSDLLDERDDIIAFINNNPSDRFNGKTVEEIKDEFEIFKSELYGAELSKIAEIQDIKVCSLRQFVNDIVERKIFDGEKLIELLEPLDLGWKARAQKEVLLMNDLVPLLKKMTSGYEISGLSAYEE